MNQSSQVEIDRILGQLCKEHHHRARQLFHELGLYRGQPRMLDLLWEQDGRTQSELATDMQNNPATITKMLQRMEATGFVERRPDPNDQRISRVYLTEKSRQVKIAVNQIYEDMASTTFEGLTLEEMLLLRRLLIHIRDNLRRANCEGRADCEE